MSTVKLIIGLALLAMSTACQPAMLDSVAKDPADLCVIASGGVPTMGNITIGRTNSANGTTVSVAPDGTCTITRLAPPAVAKAP